jgi:hypothetical protein
MGNVSLAANAAGAVTENVYSGFQLMNSSSSVIGAVVSVSLFLCVCFLPRHLCRLLVGYIVLGGSSLVLLILYAIGRSIGPVSEWLWFDVFSWIGNLLLEYLLPILLSLPVAYYLGYLLDKKGWVKSG